ncbi:MAG: LysM peptidoglycan-binding domain-containing protein [Erysipelotrichaceae bacterium]|nr:LysM peptidoglycan-binding domain-containing protein [Erysipelotrichaceae bacterium]
MNKNFSGVIIDAGHGGVDSGARGSDMLEKDYNLLISKYMYDRFRELGVPVYLTRDSDVTLEPKNRTNRILSFFGNDPNAIVISNHLNAGGGTGAEVIYALRNDSKLANSILNNIGNTGQSTRRVYQRRLPFDSTKDYYYILRDTGKTEPLIVEYGFIDNDKDLTFLKDNYKNLAEAVIKAVLEYKNIPYKEPDKTITDTYIVVKGDTLYSIAKNLDTTVEELKKLNSINNNMLTIGQMLKVPVKIVDVGDTDIYQVKEGDTLYSIANKYNISVNELKAINELDSDILSIGQILNVPSGLSLVNTYIVTKGDTLYSVAKKFDTTIDEIKKLNNLDNNMLSVGQKLLIPIYEDTTYVVTNGDTLYSIARKFNTTVDEIKRLNNLSNNSINPGQILIVRNV